MQIRKLLFLVVIILSLWACNKTDTNSSRVNQLPYYSDAHFTPHWLTSDSDSLENFHRIPPFLLINQDGDSINQQTFHNKIYVADFFFTTCPGICPKMTNNMKVLQDEFLDDDEILLLSHSVTPETDSVARLKIYAESKDIISGKWHIVTGEQQEIYSLGRRAYFVEEDLGIEKDLDEFLHTENFVLIDKNSHIRGIYNGLNKTAIQQLITDIKALKTE